MLGDDDHDCVGGIDAAPARTNALTVFGLMVGTLAARQIIQNA